jgi:hypothetical protein
MTIEERINALTFLADIWFHFPYYIDAKTDLPQTMLSAFRKCSREKSTAARTVAVSLMFCLLDKFALEKNASAPTLYKSLIFTLVEGASDAALREHYLGNFTSLFRSVPSIPIGLLADPLLKSMKSEKSIFIFKTFDFEFFKTLARHPKLNLNLALSLLELLSKIFQNIVVFATSVQGAFLDIL